MTPQLRHPLRARPSALHLHFMAWVWLVIIAKCIWVWWVIAHWQLPVHPLWIVAPTLASAALATSLWLNHERK